MSDIFRGVPSKPETFSIRPLTKGMVRNLPPALLPEGAAFDLAEANIYTEGLERRDGFIFAFLKAEGVPLKVKFIFADEVIQDFISYWTSTGSKQLLCLTNRMLYNKSGDTWIPAHWVRNYTITTLVSDTITDSTGGRNFTTDNVVAGMYVELYNTFTSSYEYYEISTVGTSTVVLAESPTGTYDSTFYIIKRFQVESPFIVDWTASATRIYFTDGYPTGIVYWNGTVLSKLEIKNSAGTDSLLTARTIDYIGDRLFFGYCTDTGPEVIRNRIRWSTALNDARVEDDAYQDLADFYGEIVRLRVLGQYNMCYLTDGVAYGRLSNITALPYVFTKIETGSVGLVGPRGVAGYLNRHFYVGVNDIYTLTEDLVPQKLSSAVNDVTIKRIQAKSLSATFVDPAHQRILFGFALNQNIRLDTYYAFYYETQAWARLEKAWATISSVSAATVPILGDYPTSTWDAFPGKTYASFGADVAALSTYYADYLGFAYTTSSEVCCDETSSTGVSISEWPDDPSSTGYLQHAWATVDGWSATDGTLLASGGKLICTSTGVDLYISKSFNFSGTVCRYIVINFSGAQSSAGGQVYYSTSGHGFTDSYRKNFSIPLTGGVVTLDMASLTAGGTDWVSNTITSIRVDLGNATSQVFSLDWMYIGSLAYLPEYAVSQSPISFCFESKDFDFDEPDKNKSLIRLGVRVTDMTSLRIAPLELVAEGSTDRGSTWKTLGTLYFRPGDDETKLNFRLTGPTLRYRLRSSSAVPPYRIEEHTLRVRGRGLEGQRGDHA